MVIVLAMLFLTIRYLEKGKVMLAFPTLKSQIIFRKVTGTVIDIKRPAIDTRHILISLFSPPDRTCFVTIEFKEEDQEYRNANLFLLEHPAPLLPLVNTWAVPEEQLDDVHLETRVSLEIIFQTDMFGRIKRSVDSGELLTVIRLKHPFLPVFKEGASA